MGVNRERFCEHCGKKISGPWFKKFCDDRCRNAFHKERRARALRLLEEREGPWPPANESADVD